MTARKLTPDCIKNGKNNKLATWNAIHLLYGALRTNSSCYADSLG